MLNFPKVSFCYILCILAFQVLLNSCDSKEYLQYPSEALSSNKAIITATDFLIDDDCRTSFTINEEKLQFAWMEKDCVGILTDGGSQIRYQIEDGIGLNKAIFCGTETNWEKDQDYYAYYPYSDAITAETKVIPIVYSKQVQDKPNDISHISEYDYMVASGTCSNNGPLDFEFNHLGALVILDVVVPTTKEWSSLSLLSKDKSFVIEGEVNLASDSFVVNEIKCAKTISLSLNNVKLTGNSEERYRYFLMIAPSDFTSEETLTVEMSSADGVKISTKVPARNFEAGHAYIYDVNFEDDIVYFALDNYPANSIDSQNGFISVQVPYGIDLTELPVKFVIPDGFRLTVDGEDQISEKSTHDFSKPVVFKLISESGKEKSFVVSICYSNLPVIYINTENLAEIDSKEEYLKTDIFITNSDYNLAAAGKIKGRGNATWRGYPKKPYKIKFSEKQSIFGIPANKSWVLLADYCDKSLLRTAYMVEAAKACGLKWNISYNHVDLILNGQYRGVYILTEHVEKSKNRINIESDGFIIEDDLYYYENLYFTSKFFNHNYTFKYPDSGDEEILAGDANFEYIKDYIDTFERVLISDDFNDPVNGYRKYIDVESWAKWYLAAELIGNLEPNLYYVLRDKQSKLEMYPMWDAEWSLGLAKRDLEKDTWIFPPAEPPAIDEQSWNKRKYFTRLFQDQYFREIVKEEWNNIRPNIENISLNIDDLEQKIKSSQEYNFKRWPILGNTVSIELVNFNTWEEEVSYAKSYYEKRLVWFDNFIKSL